MMAFRASFIAEKLGLTLKGEDREITGINTLENAGPGDVSFLANPKYAQFLSATRAGAVIVSEEYADKVATALVSANPYFDFARAVGFFAKPQGSFSGVSEMAFIDKDARLGENVTVYPFVYIGPRASIGANCQLFPGCYVGEDCVIGDGTVLYPNAVLHAGTVLGKGCIVHAGAVLGADGFGFVRTPFGIQKIPQIGTVGVGDDVEIGANTTIDRAVLGVTSVGDSTKIDNLVQLGHNVAVGKECFIVSQVGISGSTKIGNKSTLAGQVGVAGHLTIGDNVTIGPQSGVAKDIADNVTCGGSPCVDGKTFLRTLTVMPKLPDMYKRLNQLADEVKELKTLLGKETS
ncbi:UDP-3-O-acylglucosamine N-acyltransferase [uncultured delta proteobacterium]|uniref:UDP-3-O-acylglucosamine N-acyltransferase n=1 Tax=uncultured delta proteobacterium TaxID=34034 RepID=A0A212JW53_9DELT|nr:UDP-3-O-acylglucosamine N-acyltransferase [uncultured delta proteobacterium]